MATQQSTQKTSNLRNQIILAVGIVLGGLAGYAYYHFIGCSYGTCPITSKPLTSTLYGGLMGGLLGASFRKTNNTKTTA